jgi:hypothetical protein
MPYSAPKLHRFKTPWIKRPAQSHLNLLANSGGESRLDGRSIDDWDQASSGVSAFQERFEDRIAVARGP